MPVHIKIINCKHCGSEFHVCMSCWHGQAYCCDCCRKTHQAEAHCESQPKYRQTDNGKKYHVINERRRRIRLASQKRAKNNQKTVDDIGSTPPCPSSKLRKISNDIDVNLGCKDDKSALQTSPSCDFCGRVGIIVTEFPSRGYGGHRNFDESCQNWN